MPARHERQRRGFATPATDERCHRITRRPCSTSGRRRRRRRTPAQLLLRGLEEVQPKRRTTATATTPSSVFMFFFVVMISLIHFSSTTTTSGVAAAGAFLVLRTGHDRWHRGGSPLLMPPSSAAFAPTTTTRRHATVYAPPWEGGEHPPQAENDYGTSGDRKQRRSTTSAALEALLGGHESAALLARLAVAFSPTGRSLGLRDIEHVHVLALDHQHLDIQAVVCEEDGCVTLKVPVNFPAPCLVGDDDTENEDDQCVWDNLRVLDEQAQETIRELEWRDANHEDVSAQHRLHLELMQEPKDAQWWPEWWVHHQPLSSNDAASTTLLRRECDSIRKLLNDDEFRSAVAGMASLALGAADNDSMYDDYQVELAAVASVCPSGLLLRASIRPIEILGTSSTGAGAHKVLEIPVRFQGAAIVTTPDDLQSAVLGLVAAAEGYTD